jgi:hypothetical protein
MIIYKKLMSSTQQKPQEFEKYNADSKLIEEIWDSAQHFELIQE